jgi:DNA-binding HxlR family transcriptional regulator
VREVFLGNRRFDEMVRRTGAPRDTLAARLRTLVSAGILERRQYCEHPARHEYRLTDAGRELYPVILTLMRWGDRHLAGDGGPPMVLEHHCGHRLVAEVVCQECGEPVSARDTRPAVVTGHPGSVTAAYPAAGSAPAPGSRLTAPR